MSSPSPGHHAHAERPISDVVENYAKAIYSLASAGESATATTTDLAAQLGVTAGSASAMLKKLASLGIVEHTPYHGVRLTDEGERVALQVIRHHRLLELLLVELGLGWDKVHAEAEVLEHHISPEVADLIAARFGDPTHDPHGDPIPSADGTIARDETSPLCELEAGAVGRFVRISDHDGEMLRYLTDRGITLGASVEVLDRAPFDGPLTVRIAGTQHVLGGGLAEAMRIAPFEL